MTTQELLKVLNENGYTMQELADYLGCSRAYLYQVKNGRERGYSIASDLQDLLDGKAEVEGDGSNNTVQERRSVQHVSQEKPVPPDSKNGITTLAIVGVVALGMFVGGLIAGSRK